MPQAFYNLQAINNVGLSMADISIVSILPPIFCLTFNSFVGELETQVILAGYLTKHRVCNSFFIMQAMLLTLLDTNKCWSSLALCHLLLGPYCTKCPGIGSTKTTPMLPSQVTRNWFHWDGQPFVKEAIAQTRMRPRN